MSLTSHELPDLKVNENAYFAKVQQRREAKLKRDLHKYRLKYFFNRSCCSFCSAVKKRLPSGGGVYVVLLMLGLEQIAFNGSVQGIIAPFLAATNSSKSGEFFTRIIGLKLVANLLFPVAGWIADVWVGRYRMIYLSAWLMWIGYCVAALALSFQDFPHNWNDYILLPCYVVINIGSAGFQASAIPFGADQIVYKTSHELSSYFYMYYWMRNLGFTLLFLTVEECPNGFEGITRSLTYAGIGVIASTVILCVIGVFGIKFSINNKRRNPLKTVVKVLYTSAIIKRPIHRSAFSYTGVSRPSRIDLTKEIHGGTFKEETVEDVKTFLRLIKIFLPLFIILASYTGITAVADQQLGSIDGDYTIVLGCTFTQSLSWIFNVLPVLLLVPLVNFVLFPFVREYVPTMISKIGFGVAVLVISLGILLVIVITGYVLYQESHPTEPLICMFASNITSTNTDHPNGFPLPIEILILPYFFVALAEVFINVSSIELFYAQSPHTMRSMMVGFFFFWWGVSSILVEVIIVIFTSVDKFFLNCGIWYYTVLLLVACAGFIVYVFFARSHKNRQRGEIQSERFYRQII